TVQESWTFVNNGQLPRSSGSRTTGGRAGSRATAWAELESAGPSAQGSGPAAGCQAAPASWWAGDRLRRRNQTSLAPRGIGGSDGTVAGTPCTCAVGRRLRYAPDRGKAASARGAVHRCGGERIPG